MSTNNLRQAKLSWFTIKTYRLIISRMNLTQHLRMSKVPLILILKMIVIVTTPSGKRQQNKMRWSLRRIMMPVQAWWMTVVRVKLAKLTHRHLVKWNLMMQLRSFPGCWLSFKNWCKAPISSPRTFNSTRATPTARYLPEDYLSSLKLRISWWLTWLHSL